SIERPRCRIGGAGRRTDSGSDGADPEVLELVVVLRGSAEIAVMLRHVLPAFTRPPAGVFGRIGLPVCGHESSLVAILPQRDAADVPDEPAVIQHVGHLQIQRAACPERHQPALSSCTRGDSSRTRLAGSYCNLKRSNTA